MLSTPLFAHGNFVPKPDHVTIWIGQLNAVTPEVPFGWMENSNAIFSKLLMSLVNIFDLNCQRALLANEWFGGLLQEDREIVVVLNRDYSRPDIFELNLEPKVLHIPITGSETVRDGKHHVIELCQSGLL